MITLELNNGDKQIYVLYHCGKMKSLYDFCDPDIVFKVT